MHRSIIYADTDPPAPRDLEGIYPEIPKSGAPSLGHGFDEDLVCCGCGTTWAQQQREPVPCPEAERVEKAKSRHFQERCQRGHDLAENRRAYGKCLACHREGQQRRREERRGDSTDGRAPSTKGQTCD